MTNPTVVQSNERLSAEQRHRREHPDVCSLQAPVRIELARLNRPRLDLPPLEPLAQLLEPFLLTAPEVSGDQNQGPGGDACWERGFPGTDGDVLPYVHHGHGGIHRDPSPRESQVHHGSAQNG